MNTLLLPDTSDIRRRLYPSLLFCSPLHILRIAEVDTAASESDSLPFFEHELCSSLTPAPLGDKLEEFLQVYQMIGAYTQESASKASAPPREEGNREFFTLLRKKADELASSRYGPEVRQAQLTLAISEMLDRQEEILHDQLFFLDPDEIAALDNLAGEDDPALAAMLAKLKTAADRLEAPDLRVAARRVAAWQRLLQEQRLPEIKLWLASTRAAAEDIFDRYHGEDRRHASPLLSLALPAYFRESTPYIIEHIEKFKNASGDIRRGLVADFDRVATESSYRRDSTDFLLPYGTDWAGRWETMLDEFFPVSTYGRAAITFFLFPGQPLAGLLDPAGGGDSDIYLHGLLGVLEGGSEKT